MTLIRAWLACSTLPVSSSFALLRAMQTYWRSQYFYTCRVLVGEAPLSDKVARVGRRSRADTLALLHDSSDEQFRLCSRVIDVVEGVGELEDYAGIARRFTLRSRDACLGGWVTLGRDGRNCGMLGSG